VCGTEHAGLATVFRSDAPESWFGASDAERSVGELNVNVCAFRVPDGFRTFLRGHLVIPVRDPAITEVIHSIWAEIAEADMVRYVQNVKDGQPTLLPPFTGRLNSRMPQYATPSLGLKVGVVDRHGDVPLLLLNRDQDHPLVCEQVDGITLHKVWQLNEPWLESP